MVEAGPEGGTSGWRNIEKELLETYMSKFETWKNGMQDMYLKEMDVLPVKRREREREAYPTLSHRQILFQLFSSMFTKKKKKRCSSSCVIG